VLATNMAQIIESMGARNELLPTAVTLFSTGNLLGRLLCTIPSDAMVRRGWPRPLFVGGIAALAATSHLSLLCAALVRGEPEKKLFGLSLPWRKNRPIDDLGASMLQATLLQGGVLGGGLAFGAMWPHFVVLASELFGSKHLATNYMFFDGSCGAIGTMLLANALPAFVYANAARGAADCVGPLCFGPTHAVIALLCGCAVVASVAIGCKTTELYRSIAEEQKTAAMNVKDAELL
jgi:MFS family permease